MKAIVQDRYGDPDVLRFEEVETPEPKDDEVLVRVHAVSLNRSDWEGLVGKPLYARLGGLRKPNPRILGSDIAGQVVKVGKDVEQYRPGDDVFGEMPGYQGGLAEYVCAREKHLLQKPARMTFEEAAAIPQAADIAVKGIRQEGKVRPGQSVLINGAGGGAGTFAIQLVKMSEAEVTGVDHARKQDFLLSLGADHVVDYTRRDFTRNGLQYDLILDMIASRPVFAYARALKPGGSYFAAGGSVVTFFQILLLGPLIQRYTGKKIRILIAPPDRNHWTYVTDLYEGGKITPVIDRRYPFREAPEALRYLGEGRAKGKIVIIIQHPLHNPSTLPSS